MLKTILLLLTAHCLLFTASAQDYAKWVNPFIGTGGHGHTFPGATMPFGMVQLSPDTRIDNWDGSSGYHYSDDIIYGFSHTHLSGTGIPDGCDILIMPASISHIGGANSKDDPIENGYASKFSHTNEKAEPGYYSVLLDDDQILAELTATPRVGLHRYTFPQRGDYRIVLDLGWRDKVIASELRLVGERRIEGYRQSASWAKNQKAFFVAEFSKPLERSSSFQPFNNESLKGNDVVLNIKFDVKEKEQIFVKVAISSVSISGARKNLEAELPGWDFEKVRADARAAWNKELSKIEVSGGTDEQTTNFYTALYHTMIHPNVFNDVDGKYLGHDRKIHQLELNGDARNRNADALVRNEGNARTNSHAGGTGVGGRGRPRSDQYTVFSLWDTFRAAHPLYTIIDQKRTVDFINTFIRQYEQGGRLPVWELWGEETDTMIGYHSVSVIADAMAKGIEGFDYEKAYEAAKHSANLDHHGLAAYKKRGYISSEDENESVSKTLEYAYNDYCIAQMAKLLLEKHKTEMKRHGGFSTGWDDKYLWGKEDDLRSYSTRARNFENLFDPETTFFRPKRNGGFLEPFQPNEVTFHFTEGNSWVYSFFVPHDVNRLIELMGGREKFSAKLDDLFTTDQKLTGRFQPDITGLIGQYAHGNEPSHHIAYLYNYVNQPWKTQSYVRRILDDFYKNAPDGLIGNEDAGQMSAWYVMSALGFYQVNPSRPVYDIGTPIFPLAKINLENGRTFIIKAANVSPQNKYVKSVTLNGKPYRHTQFQHSDLMKGGTLEFEMAAEPVKDWFDEFSHSEVGGTFVAVPIVDGERTFRSATTVSIIPASAGSAVLYSTDGSDPVNKYLAPFSISETTKVKAVAVNEKGRRSKLVEAVFAKRPNNWTVKLVSTYNSQYPGGSDDAIIDGLRGNTNFAAGEWQGFQGKTFEAVIDLQRETEIKNVGGSFLQSARSWIWMPVNFKFEISNNGSDWKQVADIKTDVPQTEMNPVVKEYRINIPPIKARYVRVRAFNFGKIPSWHLGAGGDPWIFVDEIFIN